MRLRAAVPATVLILAAAPPAGAQAPAALTEADAEAPVALAGAGVLVGTLRAGEVRVDRFPVGGGEPRAVLAFRPPDGGRATAVRLGASATTAAAVVFANYGTFTAQPFAGPAAGPLTATEPPQDHSGGGDQFKVLSVAVDGDRLIRAEVQDHRELGRLTRYVVIDAGREPLEAVAPRRDERPVDVAGDFAAYAELVQGQLSDRRPRRMAVVNWRTGERISETLVRTSVKTFDLRADGSVLIGERGGGVLERAPGNGGLRRLSRSARTPRYAGDAIVFRRVRRGPGRSRQAEETRLFVVDPGPEGEERPIGVPTAKINAFSVDERRIAWQAHGCVLVTRIDAEAAAAPAAGACPRAEIRVPVARSVRIGPDRRVPFTLRCLAAAGGACRGSLRLHAHLTDEKHGRTDRPITAWQRFTAPTGAGRRYAVRLTAAAHRTLYRNARDGSSDTNFEVRGSTVDPDGRRGRIKGYVGTEPLALPRSLDDR